MIRLKALLESEDALTEWIATHFEDVIDGYDAWLSQHLEQMVEQGQITSADAFDRMQLFGRVSDDPAEFATYVKRVLGKTDSELRAFLSQFM